MEEDESNGEVLSWNPCANATFRQHRISPHSWKEDARFRFARKSLMGGPEPIRLLSSLNQLISRNQEE
eukprot:CAMPEP_0196731454 /NCGR_PEP_ID=MMETSP1091-20130531/11182_1 /TAXON_ID=302021 /ORGANISM="Rhodomonas sp., Strain CCMP768" /LENGTH=67 /DNA_ID=CAMNT_0042074591 /DNA_START=34 /DNA_END=237 /DNA_ORIENTATION=-